jgi:hypothetical protein
MRDEDKPKPPPPSHAAGEAPATAIRAHRGGQLDKLRVQRCTTCRAVMSNTDDDRVRYDDRDLLVLHFACSCGSRRSLYVEPA